MAKTVGMLMKGGAITGSRASGGSTQVSAVWSRLPFLLLVAATASAQTVTVSQAKANPDGTPASGTAAIRINTPCTAPGSLNVGDKTVTVPFTAGTFSVSLVRNDTCVPVGATSPGGTYYTVTWQLTGGRQTVEQWVVTAGGVISVTTAPPFNPTTIPQWPAGPKGDAGSAGPKGDTGATGAAGTSDHALLSHLDYPSSGHTGFQQAIAGAPSTWPTIPSNSSQITEGSNLYYTQARARTAFSATSPLAYDSSTGIFSCGACGSGGTSDHALLSHLDYASSAHTGFQATITGAPPTWPTIPSNTSQISESGNLYFTNARALSALAGLYEVPLTFGSGLTRSVNAISCNTASASIPGCLSTADWSAFAAKQAAIAGAPGLWPSFAAVATSGQYSDLIGRPALQYQTILANGSAQVQRQLINLLNGTNVTITCADNTGSLRTDCTISATAGAGGYATIESAGSALATRAILNFGSEFTAVDNAGAVRTDLSIASVAYGKLTGVPTSFTPSAHAASHQNGGSDEVSTASPTANAIPKAGAGGTLASGWIPVLNQNTTGTAAGLTAPYIDYAAVGGGSSIANKPTIPTASSTTPAVNGTGAAGSSANFSRGDHVHPTDTSRQAAITGAPGTWPTTFAPSAHAASHAAAGSDPVTIATSQITGLAPSATSDTTHAMSGTFALNLLGAVAGDSGSIIIEESKAVHLTRIACNVLGGTNAIISLDKRAEAAPDTDSGHHLISDLTCTTGALATTATFANGSAQCGGTSTCAVATRTPIALTITSVSGTNTALRVFVEYSID